MKSIPRLHVITDESLQPRFSHGELARLALAGGADCVQFREKRPMTTVELVRCARPVVEACRAADAIAAIDDRADIALALGAGAVHLGAHDLDAATARRILGETAIIGGTANSYDEASRVWKTDVDYLGVGPVYGTRSKANPAPAMGLETLARIAADSPKPVIAIGGIGPGHIADILRTGAHGVAVLSYVAAADEPRDAARECAAALNAALRSPGA
ncbi:MAG: thiamine phosphate synthase [Gammaproteobacteria bacterium]|nr:thiamine phosphate synthase [Gammaproteobacteria bacterium]